MLNRDFIALAVSNGRLSAVRMKKDRTQWTTAGTGEWILADFAVQTEEGATVTAADKPLARVLRAVVEQLGSADIVLTIPDEQLLCQIIKVPTEAKGELDGLVRLQIEKLAPFGSEDLSIGYEVLTETETECIVFAATVPTSITDEWDEALRINHLRAVRVEVSLLAWWRGLCAPLELTRSGRHAVLINDGSGWDLLVLDNGIPSLARAIGQIATSADFIRELTLSFLNIESLLGHQPFSELLILRPGVFPETVSPLAPLATPESMEAIKTALGVPIRCEDMPEVKVCAQGAADRSLEAGAIDLTPESWRVRERERKAKSRLIYGAGSAAAVWVLLAGFLFLSPVGCGKMTQQVKRNSTAIAARYKVVTDLQAKVRLIRAYMDRDLAAIEMLRQIALVQPSGVTLSSFTYRREEGLRLSGEADDPKQVYDFKDAVTALRRGSTEEALFGKVLLTGPSFEAQRRKHRFDLNSQFPGAKEK